MCCTLIFYPNQEYLPGLFFTKTYCTAMFIIY